jgi:hypothetical protein
MNTELIAYYVNLLILQYRNKPNAKGTITAIIKALMIYDLIRAVENGYNIDDAVGVQLDILAKYVGVERIATGVDFSRTFFGFVDYAEATPYTGVAGLLPYNEVNPPDAQFLKYGVDQESSFRLTDAELRILIKLKIAQNNSNHSTAEIDDILNEFFPGQAIFSDNFNMTISYIFDTGISGIINVAIAQGIIPKPAAVGLIVNFAQDINNIFSMQKYSADTPADFSQGFIKYSQDPFGSFLSY